MKVEDFKIGDRVVSKDDGQKGKIVESKWTTMIAVEFETPDELFTSFSSHYNPNRFELDKQYYREQRLKKILDYESNFDNIDFNSNFNSDDKSKERK